MITAVRSDEETTGRENQVGINRLSGRSTVDSGYYLLFRIIVQSG